MERRFRNGGSVYSLDSHTGGAPWRLTAAIAFLDPLASREA